jgi:hypothetical protein
VEQSIKSASRLRWDDWSSSIRPAPRTPHGPPASLRRDVLLPGTIPGNWQRSFRRARERGCRRASNHERSSSHPPVTPTDARTRVRREPSGSRPPRQIALRSTANAWAVPAAGTQRGRSPRRRTGTPARVQEVLRSLTNHSVLLLMPTPVRARHLRWLRAADPSQIAGYAGSGRGTALASWREAKQRSQWRWTSRTAPRSPRRALETERLAGPRHLGCVVSVGQQPLRNLVRPPVFAQPEHRPLASEMRRIERHLPRADEARVAVRCPRCFPA